MATQVDHLENIIGHLGAALRQQAPSDDKIIMGHVREAYESAKKALLVVEGSDHYFVAIRPGSVCTICGRDSHAAVHVGQGGG